MTWVIVGDLKKIEAPVRALKLGQVQVLDVTPLSLGIETAGGVFTRLIERNSTIPTKKSQTFSTAEDAQTSVTIRVFQGEREMAADNKLLGQFNLEDIPAAPRGVPQIEVAFDIDANGIVSVSAKDKGTGRAKNVTIQASGGLSDAEIQKMVRDAEENATADKARRELAEVKNQAEAMIHATRKTLSEHGDKVSADINASVEAAVSSLESDVQTEDADRIRQGVQRLSETAMKVGEALYKDQSGPETQAYTPQPDDVMDAEFEDLGERKK